MESSEEEGEIRPRVTDLAKSVDVPARRKFNSIVVDNENVDTGDSQDENEEEIFDTMCAICDDGGKIVSCEGRCMRSFHATKGSGINSSCETLGFNDDAQVEAIPRFFCDNCKYKMHQCFACGELGSSDRALGAEVFPCISATCGHFYHPKCVSQLIHRSDESWAQRLQEKIAAGESFTCPAHKCLVCRQGEDKEVHELQFAVCRRCPKAYHRKCLPPSISFTSDESRNIIQRAWEGYLPKRILIYCRDHTIVRRLSTPARNHIKFPNGLKMKGVSIDDLKRSAQDKAVKEMPNSVYDSFRKCKIADVKGGLKIDAVKEANAVKKSLMMSKSLSEKGGKSIVNRSSQGNKTGMPKERKSASSAMEDRISAFIEQASSEFNAERLVGKQSISSLYAPGSKFSLDKTITLSKIEGFLKAIQTALQKLEEGCAVEEAKEICEPGILRLILQWRKLKVYLGPFIHGPRYTSFGRHFTKVEKLQEIVNRLQWYVQDGDTIVDFCCGSNEFSCLMKEKLDKIGKCCFFKNYDLFPPKIPFQFEKRDWMSVDVEELPDGSQLIMGLNPPFGVNASLANKFINKALTFKPKLLILIVPRETKRLDSGADPYDLLWEDCELLSGKSFYLPGSIDVHNKRLEDWNLTSPPLYLWSRRDWTSKHKTIAVERGHISKQESIRQGETNAGAASSNYLMEENYDCYQDYFPEVNANIDLSSIFDDFPDDDAVDGANNSPLIANFKSTLQHESLRAFGTPIVQPREGFQNLQPSNHGNVPMQPEHHRTFEVPGMQPQHSLWNLQPNSHGYIHALPNQQSTSQLSGHWPPSSSEHPPHIRLNFPFDKNT
ncbi:hypothetical protein BT93_A1467 [Corymbia citriodora subsp. variegata]|nr:hypothetical protein BT93_A1467 [Corymbia citriodora subsp. variegata]